MLIYFGRELSFFSVGPMIFKVREIGKLLFEVVEVYFVKYVFVVLFCLVY